MAADTLSRVFSALADPTRRDMVARLADGDATVSQLAEPYRMTLQAVYKHLRVLEDAGLVSRPRGPQPRPVRLETEVLNLMDIWIERYRRPRRAAVPPPGRRPGDHEPIDDKDGADDDSDPRDDHRG